MSETKAQKFERVAKPRIENAEKALSLLQNLIAADYQSTVERREEIVQDIERDIQELRRVWKLQAADVDEALQDKIHREAAPQAAVQMTDRIAKEAGVLSDLSTQQLVDRMIACGAELARRRQ